MTNTDSGPFMNLVPAISLRENERGTQTGAGWNPTLAPADRRVHDVLDKDFRLGLNAAQTTLRRDRDFDRGQGEVRNAATLMTARRGGQTLGLSRPRRINPTSCLCVLDVSA